ncbi:MAG: AAA family ATPase [Planctomycetes bacterium]|nr:AAA family ATPase [Planctomycetota bacterium]
MAKRSVAPEKGTITRKQKITRVAVSDFMRLEALEFSPKGHTIRLCGNNDQGKSSLLTFIRAVLGGKYEFPAMPVRKGAEAASGSIDTDDLRIDWRLADGAKEHTFTITDKAKGKKIAGAPQSLLRKLFGTFALDPLSFLRKEPRDQVQYLGNVMRDADGNAIDLAEYQKAHDALYEARSERNRERKAAQAVLEQHPPVPDAPARPVDLLELSAAIEAAQASNADRARVLEAVERAAAAVNRQTGVVADLEARLKTARADHERMRLELERASEAAQLAGEPADVEPLRKRRDDAAQINAAYAAQQRHNEAQAKWEVADQAHRAADKALDDHVDAHRKRLQAANMPVEGLEWRSDMLWYQGVPLSQNSTRNKLFVTWHLALAEHPDMPIVIFDDANVLDDDAQRLIAALSEKHDAQTWLVFVGENIEGAQLTIRDGKAVK